MANLNEVCGQELEDGTVRVRYSSDGADVSCLEDCFSYRVMARNIGQPGVNWVVSREDACHLNLVVEELQAKNAKCHLMDYETGAYIRAATEAEYTESEGAGPEGVITVCVDGEDRSCYVV